MKNLPSLPVVLRSRLFSLLIALGLCLSSSGQAKAVGSYFLINIDQVGNNVVATGSGDFDFTGLIPDGTVSDSPLIWPANSFILSGLPSPSGDAYIGIGLPASFGAGGFHTASSATGVSTGIFEAYDINSNLVPALVVPHGYTSGTVSTSTTFANATFSSLGFTPGSYALSWNGGADEFVVDVQSSVVPEPSQYGFFAVLAFAGLLTWRRFSTRTTAKR
jgi:hypothetical protein